MYDKQTAIASPIGQQISAARPETTLEAAVGSLHRGVGELSSCIAMLGERLQGVLTPPVPTAQQTANGVRELSAVAPMHSPTVSELHKLRSHMETLACTVNDLASRLET